MAYPVQVTLGTGNTVSLNYQSQNVAVSITYQLERADSDLLALVQEKTAELAQAHRLAWQGLHDAKVLATPSPVQSSTPPVDSRPTDSPSTDSQPANAHDEKPQEANLQLGKLSAEISSTEPSCDDNLREENLPKTVATTQQNGASLASLPSDEWTELAAPLEKAPLEPATIGQCRALRVLLDQSGWQKERITAHLLAQFGCESIEDLTAAQAAEWLLELQRAARVANEQQKLQAVTQTSRNGARTGTTKKEGK